ncbi:MAG TPA: ABC transporter ATP-binding protein [Castellaniella sp.]|uniref:ABC transporter ATP-binding protein n=1 Tax=Castellaniella sp. TaxID=1955812 RepID=UPI002F0C7C19
MSLLDVTELRKTFGGFHAVDGVSFAVEEGSIHAVIGPNGAGKTTMFNLISGHSHPSAGAIRFAGDDVTQSSPDAMVRRGLTRAFQVTTIFPKLTVLESVECAISARRHQSASLWLWNRPTARAEALQLLETVGLAELADVQAATMSHGDQRTLEVTLALATQPKLLLLDEPTAGMSPFETKKMVELVRDLTRSRGLTVLFCEHDIGTVFTISDKVTVLHRGQIIADGAPDAVRTDQRVIDVYLGRRNS